MRRKGKAQKHRGLVYERRCLACDATWSEEPKDGKLKARCIKCRASMATASYECVGCGHHFEDMPGSVSCPACGHSTIHWLDYERHRVKDNNG